jgi:hypothetical protein
MIVRHPASTTLSRFKQGWVPTIDSLEVYYENLPECLKNRISNFEKVLSISERDSLSLLFCMVCLCTLFGFNEINQYQLKMPIFYFEDLLRNPSKIFYQLFKYIDFVGTYSDVKDVIIKPSRTTSNNSPIFSNQKDKFSYWKKDLPPETIFKFQDILEMTGLGKLYNMKIGFPKNSSPSIRWFFKNE